MPASTDTIAALATPIGTSAIAVVRASGPACAGLAAAALSQAPDVSAPRRSPPPPRLARHADYRDRSGAILDDVLATYFAAPHSYTGDDTLEIACHGNPFIAQKILEDLLARGCRAAGPGEFTRRAFLNGRIDLSQAEAVMDLIHARGERALAAANQQLRGSLGRHVTALTDELLQTLARVEAYIDFPDEDLPPEDRSLVRRALAALTQSTARLLATRHYGELLREGIKTIILGEPNAGKSSLLNRLIGHDRAIVSPEPGTTRDFIEERLLLGPHCLRLIDTAGLNPSPAPLEKLGMDKTLERATEADLFILVLDATRPSPTLPQEITERMTPENTLVILNKTDLLSGQQAAGAANPNKQNPEFQKNLNCPTTKEIQKSEIIETGNCNPIGYTPRSDLLSGNGNTIASATASETRAQPRTTDATAGDPPASATAPSSPPPHQMNFSALQPSSPSALQPFSPSAFPPPPSSPALPHPENSPFVIRHSSLIPQPVSALTGAGIPALTEAIVARAEAFRLDQGDELIAINARHADALARARTSLAAADANLAANGPVELLASDLRAALDALGEIAGRIDNERILDRLFATFCIGK
jgi:tRNA modification GTPase